MPYILDGDSLTIYYNEFVQKGKVLKATKYSLIINWNDIEGLTGFIE